MVQKKSKNSGFAITSLILGILSFFVSGVIILPLVTVASFISGGFYLYNMRSSNKLYMWLSIIGICLSFLSIIIGIVLIILHQQGLTNISPLSPRYQNNEDTKFFILLFVGILVYLLPSTLAFSIKHKYKAAILILNLLLGWTFIGWVAALIWVFINTD